MAGAWGWVRLCSLRLGHGWNKYPLANEHYRTHKNTTLQYPCETGSEVIWRVVEHRSARAFWHRYWRRLMDSRSGGCALFLPWQPQFHKPNRCWTTGRVMGESPDSHGRLQGDNFGLRRTLQFSHAYGQPVAGGTPPGGEGDWKEARG